MVLDPAPITLSIEKQGELLKSPPDEKLSNKKSWKKRHFKLRVESSPGFEKNLSLAYYSKKKESPDWSDTPKVRG